jgi:PTS system ascorbate-specific IIB component
VKILVCCGSGLGSSFMIEMNVQNVLKELGVVGVEVDHSDLGSAKGYGADLYVGTRDIAPELETIGKPVISLNNMLDIEELRKKLSEKLKEMNIF